MPVAPNVGLTAIIQKRSTVNRILPNRRFEYGECVMERFRSPAVEKRARWIGDLRVVVHGDVVHVPCRKCDWNDTIQTGHLDSLDAPLT